MSSTETSRWRPLTDEGWGSLEEAGTTIRLTRQGMYSMVFGRALRHPHSKVQPGDVRKIGMVYVIRLAALQDLSTIYPAIRPADIKRFCEDADGWWSMTELAHALRLSRTRVHHYLDEGRIPARYVRSVDNNKQIAVAARGVRQFYTAYQQSKAHGPVAPIHL